MRWEYIDSDAALDEMLRALADASVIAMDTEFMRVDTYYPKVALLQLATESGIWLIDPLRIERRELLADLLRDESRLKVLHSGSEDIEVFHCWLGVAPAPLFDTQRAAALVGRGFGLGYRQLVSDICGIELPKGETRSDWLQRPLSRAQCEYAAQDVVHLIALWQALDREAQHLQRRSWILEEGVTATSALDQEVSPLRRIKGGARLQGRQLSVLYALARWREETAIDRDRPRGWILNDKVCVQIAHSLPADLEGLAGAGVPAGALRRYGQTLLSLIDSADEEPPEQGPDSLDSSARASVKKLKQTVRRIAENLDVAPEILFTARDCEWLVRLDQGEAVAVPRSWQGWRSGAVVEPLRRQLQERI